MQRRRRRCGLSLEVLCERCVVHGTARCGGSRCGSRGAAPRRPVRQKMAVRGGTRALPTGDRRVGFAARCCWSWWALDVQLLLRCCGASPRSLGRVRGVRGCKRASSARIPRGGAGAGDGQERRWRAAGKGATAPSRRAPRVGRSTASWSAAAEINRQRRRTAPKHGSTGHTKQITAQQEPGQPAGAGMCYAYRSFCLFVGLPD